MGNHDIIDVIRSTAPSFIFTTSMSPVMAAGALASVQTVRSDSRDRRQMLATANWLKSRMLEEGIPLMSAETHIMPVLVGDGNTCKAMADHLLEQGIYVQPINFPSVPKGEELLRFTASPRHTDAHCNQLLSVLKDLCAKHGLLRAPRNAAVTPQPTSDGAHACICVRRQDDCTTDSCPALMRATA